MKIRARAAKTSRYKINDREKINAQFERPQEKSYLKFLRIAVYCVFPNRDLLITKRTSNYTVADFRGVFPCIFLTGLSGRCLCFGFFHRHFLSPYTSTVITRKRGKDCSVIAIKSRFFCWFFSRRVIHIQWHRPHGEFTKRKNIGPDGNGFCRNYCGAKLDPGLIRIYYAVAVHPYIYIFFKFKFEI